MNKKKFVVLVLLLVFSFDTEALASFTFSSSAITGAGATMVDTGSVLLSGSTSGKVTIAPAVDAGTYTLTLPTDDGILNQVLTTDGNGVLSWSTVSGGGGMPGGSDTQVQFNNSGVFGGDAGMTYNPTTKILSARVLADGSNSIIGSNLITNGTFTGSATGWNLGTNVTYSNNHIVSLYNGGDPFVSTSFETVTGETYVINFRVSNSNAPVGIYLDNTWNLDYGPYIDGLWKVSFVSEYTGTETIFFDDNDYANGDTWELDDVSIFKVDPDAVLLDVKGLSGKSILSIRSTDVSSIAFGDGAWATRTGPNTIAIGANALNKNTTGEKNVAVGENALLENTTGNKGVAIGHEALYLNTTGFNNIAIGDSALKANTTGTNSIAIGVNALRENNGTGINIAIGTGALYLNTTGNQNIAIGDNALYSNTIGGNNVTLGVQAGYLSSTGSNNTIVGNRALYLNTGGSYNTAFGASALYTSNNADDNTALGYLSLYSSTSGNSNTAVGKEAGTTSGSTPLFANAVTTGSDLTFLGYQSGLGSATQRNNSSAIGAGAYVDADNTVVLGNGAVTEVLMNSLGTAKIRAGNLKLSSLPVYADNAAALDGGLVAGDVYRTATGVLMVTY